MAERTLISGPRTGAVRTGQTREETVFIQAVAVKGGCDPKGESVSHLVKSDSL